MPGTVQRTCLMLGGALLIASPAVAQKSDAKKRARIDHAAPDFTLTDCNGKQHKLSDLKGKIVVLEWINKGCPFSVKANPTMIKTAVKYKDKGVIWLAIDSTHFNKAADNANYIKQKDIPYPILMDLDGAVAKTYRAKSTPHMFVIDKNGELAYSGAIDNRRTKDGYRNHVAEAIDLLLEGKPVEVSKTRPYGCRVKYKE